MALGSFVFELWRRGQDCDALVRMGNANGARRFSAAASFAEAFSSL
jgi:hypothetical protein